MINEQQQIIQNEVRDNLQLCNLDFPSINNKKQTSIQYSQMSEDNTFQIKNNYQDQEISTDIEFSCDLFNDQGLKQIQKSHSIDMIQENINTNINSIDNINMNNNMNNSISINMNLINDQIQEEDEEDYFDDGEQSQQGQIQIQIQKQQQQLDYYNQQQQKQIIYQEEGAFMIQNQQQQQQQEIFSSSSSDEDTSSESSEEDQEQYQQQQQQQIFQQEDEISSEIDEEDEDDEEEEDEQLEEEFDQDTQRNTVRNSKKTFNLVDLNKCLKKITEELMDMNLEIEINFLSVLEKCERTEYQNQEQFKSDFEKMFEILYFNNTRNSSIYQETMKMQRKFIQLYSQFDAKYAQVQIQRLNQTSNFFLEQEDLSSKNSNNLPLTMGSGNQNQNTVSFDLSKISIKKQIQKKKNSNLVQIQRNNNQCQIQQQKKKRVIWSFAKIKEFNYCIDESLQKAPISHSFTDLKQPHFFGPNQIQQQQEFFEEIEKQNGCYDSDDEEENSEFSDSEEDTFDRFQKKGKIQHNYKNSNKQLKSCLKKLRNNNCQKKKSSNNMIIIKQGPLMESEFEDDELTTDQI